MPVGLLDCDRFLHLESRRVSVVGITRHPDEEWMQQMAPNATHHSWGPLNRCRYVLHDRDTKFCAFFRSVLAAGGVKTIQLPARSPNLNAFAERWVRSVKEDCLSKLILFGERPLSRALSEFSAHYHGERNHQGKGTNCSSQSRGDEPKHRGHTTEYLQRLVLAGLEIHRSGRRGAAKVISNEQFIPTQGVLHPLREAVEEMRTQPG